MEEPPENKSEYYAILNVAKDASTEEIVRSYRKLAQVFHPDKLPEKHRNQAKESFSKVQEAYEVLRDPPRRQIYDVYGKQGLAAGLELGDHLRSRDELKMEWERFKAAQEKEKEEHAVVQKGSYSCRVDASRLVHGDWGPSGRPVGGPMGLFKAVTAQNALDTMVGDKNVLSLSGQAMVRPVYRRTPHGLEEVTLGGGNVVFGFRRMISQDDTIDASCQLGLATLLSFTTSRRLDPLTGRDAYLNASWGPSVGLGLQAGCSQSLFKHGATQGNVNVVFGPASASGVATSITHKAGRWTIVSKLEIGAMHSISGRVSVAVSQNLTLRAIARLGSTGIDLELGAAQKLAPQVSGYMGASVGYPSGVLLKLRLTRANQSLECPITMSSSYDDWKVLVAVYTIPPLVFLATSRFIARPLLSWSKVSKERTAQAAASETVRVALAQAAAEQSLIDAVARRKVTSEQASPSGLVILEAVYGILDEYFQARTQQIQQRKQHGGKLGSSMASTSLSSNSAAVAGGAHENARGSSVAGIGVAATAQPAQPVDTPAASGSGDSSRGEEQNSSAGHDAQQGPCQRQQQEQTSSSNRGAAGGGESSSSSTHADSKGGLKGLGQGSKALPPPPQWLRVTRALQYLVASGQLLLAKGVSKSGLMGFTDPAPYADATAKQLYVAFKHKGATYEVVIGDLDSIELPPDLKVRRPGKEGPTLAEEEMGAEEPFKQRSIPSVVTDPTTSAFLESCLKQWLEHGEH